MKQISISKFLIAFVLAVLNNVTRVGSDPTDVERILAHIRQGRHWDFLWFSKVKGIGENSSSESMLKILSPTLGCAYGGNLNWFLLLALEAVGECDNMRRNNHPNANGCKNTLNESIKRGKFVIFKLMRVLRYIDTEIKQDVENDKFYQVLQPLEVFLTGQIDIAFNEPVPGSSVVNALLTSVADSLGIFLHFTCRPEKKLFSLPAIMSQHSGSPITIYVFYVKRLKMYVEDINNHLLQLGFHYDHIIDSIIFDPNLSTEI